MSGDPVELRIGGKAFRIVATADADTLKRLAAVVEAKLAQIDSRHPDALLLVALALAKDVEDLTGQNQQLNTKSREILRSLLTRVDSALGNVDENGEPLPKLPGT